MPLILPLPGIYITGEYSTEYMASNFLWTCPVFAAFHKFPDFLRGLEIKSGFYGFDNHSHCTVFQGQAFRYFTGAATFGKQFKHSQFRGGKFRWGYHSIRTL